MSYIKNYSTRDFVYFFSKVSIELYKKQLNEPEAELRCSITFPLNAILHGFIHRQVQVMLSAWDIQDMAYVSIVSANDYRKEIMTREKAGTVVNLYRGYENEHSNSEYIKDAKLPDGSCGIYNFILPVDYRLTELHIVDPFDNNKNLKKKKHFKYDVFYDCESHIQVVQMQLRSARGNFSFILTGEACIDDGKNKFIDCKEQNIYLDEDIREFFFDDGIKKSFWKNLKESILLEPNFNGIGIDLKKLFQK